MVSTALKNSQKWGSSPNKGENKKCLKPPPSICLSTCFLYVASRQVVKSLDASKTEWSNSWKSQQFGCFLSGRSNQLNLWTNIPRSIRFWDTLLKQQGICVLIWVFPKIGVPQNGWFIPGNPIKMDDLGGKPTILGNPPYKWTHFDIPQTYMFHHPVVIFHLFIIPSFQNPRQWQWFSLQRTKMFPGVWWL